MVEKVDAELAQDIMRFALFKEVPKRQRKSKKGKSKKGGAKRRGSADPEGSDEDSDDDEDGDAEGSDDGEPEKERMSMPPATDTPAAETDPIWGDMGGTQDIEMADSTGGGNGITSNNGEMSTKRQAHIYSLTSKANTDVS